MKNLFLILISFVLLYACTKESIDNQTQLEFTRLADFPGEDRRSAAYFELNNNLYFGLGECHNDFWRFSLTNQAWTQLSDFPGVPNNFEGMWFSSNETGYLLYFGGDCSGYYDVPIIWGTWKYKPENSWDTITVFDDSYPFGYGPSFLEDQYFKIDDTAYTLAAKYPSLDTTYLFAFDPGLNTWFRKKDFPGFELARPVILTIGKKGYIGISSTGASWDETPNPRAFWEYNSETDTWKQLNDFPGNIRVLSANFSLKGKGYVVGGGKDGTVPLAAPVFTDIWEYTPETDTWEKIGDAPAGFFKAQTITVGDNAAYIYQADLYYEESCLPGGFWKVSVK